MWATQLTGQSLANTAPPGTESAGTALAGSLRDRIVRAEATGLHLGNFLMQGEQYM